MDSFSQCGVVLTAAALSACAQAGSPVDTGEQPGNDATAPCASADPSDSNPCNTADAQATCADAPDEGYVCFCSPGFKAQGDTCVDIDACAAGDSIDGNPCNADDLAAACADEAAPSTRYNCACSAGYEIDGGRCVEIDECLVGDNPCDDAGDLGASCEDLVADIACTCSDDAVTGKLCDVFGLVGTGAPGDPFVWADGQPAVSCEEYIRPLTPRYSPASPPIDGFYRIDAEGDGERVEAFCDMTTNGGGWHRVVHWDREQAPAIHTLQTLVAQGIDEIGIDRRSDPSPMGRVSDEADHVLWMDADLSADVLSYRFVFPSPASEVMASIHLSGSSLDNSGVFLFASNQTTGASANLVCADVLLSLGAYSEEEEALFPYPCLSLDPNFVYNDIFTANLAGATADSVVLRGFMFDLSLPDGEISDVARLYRLTVFTRSKRLPPTP